MAIGTQFNNLKAHTTQLGGAVKDAFKTTFSRDGWRAGPSATVVKDSGGFLGVLAKPFVWTAKAGVALLKIPVDLGLRAGNFVVDNSAQIIKKNPKTAIIGGAAVAAFAGSRWLAKRNAQQLAVQADMVDQLQAQAAAPVSYMNSASQADVDARIAADRAAGTAASSQTAALAARQAMAPEATQAI